MPAMLIVVFQLQPRHQGHVILTSLARFLSVGG